MCSKPGGPRHELEPLPRPDLPDRRRGRRHRDADRAAGARPRRLRGAPRAAGAAAADGRAVHLLRPGRTGGVRHRPGRGRAAASAHRARHRDLPVPRRVPAPRQPRLRPDHPSRRGELDDRRKRRHPFRAHQRRHPAASAFAVRHPDLGGAARGGGGRRGGVRARRPRDAAGAGRGGGDGPADPRHRLGRAGAGPDLQRDVLRRRRARRPARGCRCRTVTRTAGSISSAAAW